MMGARWDGIFFLLSVADLPLQWEAVVDLFAVTVVGEEPRSCPRPNRRRPRHRICPRHLDAPLPPPGRRRRAVSPAPPGAVDEEDGSTPSPLLQLAVVEVAAARIYRHVTVGMLPCRCRLGRRGSRRPSLAAATPSAGGYLGKMMEHRKVHGCRWVFGEDDGAPIFGEDDGAPKGARVIGAHARTRVHGAPSGHLTVLHHPQSG
ncbi:hypothetical protein ACLOJK_021163 [Asimina triloba]